MKIRRVEVVPYDDRWPDAFLRASQRLCNVLGDNHLAIHHMGSTSIPGMDAKPIIDLLGEVRSIAAIDDTQSAIEALGYEAMGELGIVGRRYFRKENAEGIRIHHFHVFQTGSPEIDRHLAFRNYLIANPAIAQDYRELKLSLAQQFPTDIDGYMDGKDAFITAIDRTIAQHKSMVQSAFPVAK
jgi:GrpB-like predicted nucleotidyltransferase (UPF0157 family)